ncbi:MAG: glycosyltransferase family 2 protein [Spirochaetes bacterium]|nr:glycosyltransferase family 2 protein [Spirochaetota bacterium]
MKQGFLIPVYRHAATAGPLAEKLSAFGLPIILVDDGNTQEAKDCLGQWAAKIPCVILVSLKKNSGKGGAVMRGIEKAAELGLTHVLQIDADGQHDIKNAAFFLEESARNPKNIICGYPEFDETAPKSRVTGRKISNFWAAVTSLSGEFRDVLCGFRVYPVDAALRASRHLLIDKRMGFDPEILIRLYWKGVFPIYHPIKVSYPQGGISNFHMVKDNLRISWMFSRLCAGMLIRLPFLLVMRICRQRRKGSHEKS